MFFTRRNNHDHFRHGNRPGRRWLAEVTRLAPAVECLEDRKMLSATSLARFSDFSSLKINFDSYSEDRVLVQISDDATQEEIADLFDTWGDNELNPFTELTAGLYQIYVNNFDSVESVVEDYRRKDGVAMAELDYVIELSVVQEPNDPNFSSLWGMNNTGQTGGTIDADIDALEAWDTTTGSSEVIVAVIDTGIDYTHADLADNMWINTGEIAGNGIDDDGNGYIDDIYGYDFFNNDGDPFDDNGHGTHVSGTIAGAGNNNIGVIGVAPNVKIMALKFLSGGGYGYISGAVRALDYAVSMGAQISNNSWGGGGFSSSLYASLQNARAAGHIFVAAAGNSANDNDVSPSYPATYDLDNVISVAATDHNDNLAWFSSYGATTVDLAAPGVSVYSTTPGNTYSTYSGTSMATPHVTGVVALVMSQHPDWTYDQIINQVLSTTDTLSNLDGIVATGGRLNAASAVGAPAPIVDRHGDSAAEATLIAAWDNIGGTIGTDTDTDWFQLDVRSGFTYSFDVSLGSLTDSTLTLYDQDGTTQLAFDDNSGVGMGSQIVWNATVNQTVYLQVDAKFSTLTGSYSILATHDDDHGNTYLDSTPTTIGITDGVIENGGDVDFFSFQVVAGQTYTIETNLGTLSDTMVNVYDQNGNWEAFNDDTWTSYASRLLWTADYTGTAHVSVEAYSSTQTGSYELHLGTPTPADLENVPVISGNIETNGDANFFEIQVQEGYTYAFETTLGTLPDSWLDLYDANGDWVTYDDDGGDGFASRLEWTATYTGNAFIGVEGYWFTDTGTYALAINQIVLAPTPTSPLNGSETTFNPTFEWSAMLGAAGYNFWLTDFTSGQVAHINYDVLTNSYSVPIDLEVDHNYMWWVQAETANGYTSSWSVGQYFTVVNQAPVLDAISDQSMSTGTDMLNLALSATDPDGNSLAYSVEVLIDPAELHAYNVDQTYNLDVYDNSVENNYWLNSRGYNERYLVGFYILPNGELYHWGGSMETSALVATVDSRYYNDPSLLANATLPTSPDVTANIAGSTLTIDPADGYTGTFQVRVSVSDGVETVSQAFNVTVVNNAPVLTPVSDQSFSHATDFITLGLSASDAEGDALTYSVEIGGDPLAQTAYDIDQQYNLDVIAGSDSYDYWYNYRGAGEKYLANGFFLLPDGSLYHWGGSIADSTYIVTLDSSYHADPTLLTNAQPPSSSNVTATINGTDLTIDPADGYTGSFQVTVSVSDGVNISQQTFTVSVTNNTPVLGAIGDQTMADGDDFLTVNLSTYDSDGDALSYTVEIGADVITAHAYNLDQNYGFDVIAGSEENNYWYNYRGAGEKYLANGFFLLSDGSLYKWGGSIGQSTYIATLDSTFHTDPTLLTNAQLPSAANVFSAVSGATLTLDPDATYNGRFEVTVSVSDGMDVVRQTFLVNRDQAGSSSLSLQKTDTNRSSGGSATAIVSLNSSTDSQTQQSDTDSLAGLFTQTVAASLAEPESFDNSIEDRVDLNSNTQSRSSQAQPSTSAEGTASVGDLDSFLESLPGLESVSELSKSDDLDSSDGEGDDLDKALDRIFAEGDSLKADSLLDDLMVV